MRKIISSFVLFLVVSSSKGQNVGIGTTTPHQSAALDISDSTKGILIPRMTMVKRNSIQNPAEGLMVYQTDGTKGYWYFDGISWKIIQNSLEGNLSNGVSKAIFDTSGTWVVPSGITRIIVEAWSAGGGGGGGAENSISCEQILNSSYAYNCYWYSSGGGGASGSYCKTNISVVPGETLHLSVGRGGKGGQIGQNGENGENTGITNYFSILGGRGGGSGLNNIFPYPIPPNWGGCNSWGFGGTAGLVSNISVNFLFKANGISGIQGINGKACNGPDGNSFLVGGSGGSGTSSIHQSSLFPNVILSSGGNGGRGGRIYNPNYLGICSNELSQIGTDGKNGLIVIEY